MFFGLALLAMVVNVFLVDYAPMRVNGFATAPGCRFACPGLGAPLGFQPAIVRFACAVFALARGFSNVNDRQLAVNASQLFLGLLCSLWSSMLCGYGAQWSLMVSGTA